MTMNTDETFLYILDYFLWREGHILLQFLTYHDKLPSMGDHATIKCPEQWMTITAYHTLANITVVIKM